MSPEDAQKAIAEAKIPTKSPKMLLPKIKPVTTTAKVASVLARPKSSLDQAKDQK
jgi:hypothetical protein